MLQYLEGYNLKVVITTHANLDIEGSDVDIICCYQDQADFISYVENANQFPVSASVERQKRSVVWRFVSGPFDIEVYGSDVPVFEQPGWLHFIAMRRLVKLGGRGFQVAIRALKSNGMKTEPAIAHHLRLSGDPYVAVMELAGLSDEILIEMLG